MNEPMHRPSPQSTLPAVTAAIAPSAMTMWAALALSWLGMYLHTLWELELPVWSPENSGPLLIAAALGVAWWRRPGRPVALLIMGWAILQLVGGAVLSVLPLGLFPFDPEQTLGHYASHMLYGILQIPLLLVAWRARAAT